MKGITWLTLSTAVSQVQMELASERVEKLRQKVHHEAKRTRWAGNQQHPESAESSGNVVSKSPLSVIISSHLAPL